MKAHHLTSLIIVAILTGCSSTTTVEDEQHIIPKGKYTMKEIYERQGSLSKKQDRSVLSVTKRPASDGEMSSDIYQINQIANEPQFRMLDNPTLYLYFPAKISKDGMPIPAWMTQIKMYNENQYALPGEVAISSGAQQ
ncbi:hypothetical protein LDJ79_00875 [Vibrio tritonius]|uniref:Conjugal transfer protein n=1 Tax=Vibrio tritonius TaxID=1435069 RepID=A0ABS7YG61_9VIBR|nr:hypothetical protein [Vibrio tritonius]MCA2014642.1 hypothetical protein [Vibrio tritonius]